jgi:beta-xylosidase
MAMRRMTAYVAGLLLCGAAHSSSSPYVHDPVVIRQADTYYLFGTGQGIDVHSSKDLKSWRDEPHVFDRAPDWTFATVPGFQGHIWAPDISEHNGIAGKSRLRILEMGWDGAGWPALDPHAMEN